MFVGASPVITPETPFLPRFDPLSLITGAGGFWRADVGVTGSPSVTAWADQSSFGNNLSVLGGGTSPQFSSTGFNSAKPGITITDGSTQNLGALLASFSSTTVSVFFLMQSKAISTGFGRFMAFVAPGAATDFGDDHSFEFDVNTASSNNLSISSDNSGAGDEEGNGGSPGPVITVNSLYLLGVVFDGAHASRWTAGAALGAQTVRTNTFGNAVGNSTFQVGRITAFGNGPTGAAYAFVGLTQKAMNATDWSNLKTWSNSNWGTSF